MLRNWKLFLLGMCLVATADAAPSKKVAANNESAKTFTCTTAKRDATTVDLLQVYYQAKQNDPEYLGALESWRSSREALPQGLAGLLPVVNLSANIAANKNETNGVKTSTFRTRGYSGTLTQPVIDIAAWETLRQATATVKQARAVLVAAEQSLITRVASAYFAVLLAQDTYKFVQDEFNATEKQYKRVQARNDAGLDSWSQVLSARAQRDSLDARRISAKNNVENARLSLEEITGRFPGFEGYPNLAKLYTKKKVSCKEKNVFKATLPQPASVGEWVGVALQGNPAYVAARYGVSAASANLGVKAAGHLPTLDAKGSITRSDNNNPGGKTNTFNQVAKLEATLPIFAGGGIFSKTREAYFDYEKAKADRLKQERNVISSTRQNYNDIIAGIQQIKADERAVDSAKEDVETKKAEYQVGKSIITDLLDAISDLSEAKNTLASDQYSYLNNILSLKSNAGTLQEGDVVSLNQHFIK